MSTTDDDPERYVSGEELKAELPFNEQDFPVQSETVFQNALQRALGSASRMVESWGSTRYQPTEHTERLWRASYTPENELPLPKRPVQSVTSVAIDGDALAAEDYRVLDTHLVLTATDPGEWPTDEPVEVTWTYGFEDPPEPVREAIIRLARNALDQIETDGYEGDDEGGFRPPEAIKRECAAMVAGYDAPSYYAGISAI